jgi:hypothetical protein
MGSEPERSPSSAIWPVFANKYHCVVNQKCGENFEVGNICLRKYAEVRVVSPEGRMKVTVCQNPTLIRPQIRYDLELKIFVGEDEGYSLPRTLS